MMQLLGPLADRDAWTADRCSVDKAVSLIGTRSAILIIREAYFGATRFEQFASRVGITEQVAAKQLKKLTASGIFQKVPYQDPGQRTRYAYELTEMGRDLLPVIIGLLQWGDRYLQPEGPPVVMRDRSTSSGIRACVRSTHGKELGVDDIEVARGDSSTGSS